MMGIMYDYGHGVIADPQQALAWYLKSAEQGEVEVQYQVGAKYFKGETIPQNYTEAAKWWEKAASAGQVDAQFNLGLMYYRGLGVAQDDNRAAALFKSASDKGHANAQYSLAVMYAFARGVEKNYDTALQLFEKAADKNVAQAQYNLGIFYENGYGVTPDLVRAREWYQRAAVQGLEEAKTKLNALSARETATPVEPVASVETTPSAPTVNEPEPQATPAPNYTVSEMTTNGIKREDWVTQQKPDTYTIQIGSVLNEADIVKFLKQHHIEDNSAYIQVVINGTTRYNALYGAYTTYAEAEQAAANLPDSLKQITPWIRNFGILQKMLK